LAPYLDQQGGKLAKVGRAFDRTGAETKFFRNTVCGYETDEDALLFHGFDDEILDLASITQNDSVSLSRCLNSLYPDMPEQMRQDLLPLLEGNLKWIAQVRNTCRLLEIEHREWMICLGRGFDFLHTPNLALIIGPYSPDLADPIRKAAGIIEANMRADRIPNDGFLLLYPTSIQIRSKRASIPDC